MMVFIWGKESYNITFSHEIFTSVSLNAEVSVKVVYFLPSVIGNLPVKTTTRVETLSVNVIEIREI